MAAIPLQDRISALQVQLLAWQPFPNSEMLVEWQGAYAQVFAISTDVVNETGASLERLLPESICRGVPETGCRLLASLEGFEGQSWHEGVLRASRWWAKTPDVAEWLAFVRASGAQVGADADLEGPVPAHARWLKPARFPKPVAMLEVAVHGRERLLVLGLVLMMTLFAGMQAREAWDAYQQWSALQADLDRQAEETKTAQRARANAIEAAEASSALIRQLQSPRPTMVMRELAARLPKGVTVREFDLRNNTLRLLLDLPPEVSRGQLVSALESGSWFAQVRESKDGMPRTGLGLEMVLSDAWKSRSKDFDDAGLKLTSAGAANAASAVLAPASPNGERRP